MINNCLICKKNFTTSPSEIKIGKGKFCSKECADIFKRGKTPNWKNGYYQHKPQQGFQKGHKPFGCILCKGHKIRNTGRTRFKKGEHLKDEHPNWKGGRYKTRGYVFIYKLNHPYAKDGKYVQEHRFVMEKHIGRYLKPSEKVHHVNEITDDNRIENLMLFKNQTYHTWFHIKGFSKPEGIIFDGRNIK